MISLRNVCVAIGEFSLNSVNLEIGKGEYFVILGPNGGGKSSLYRALRLLADVAQGRVVQSLAAEGGSYTLTRQVSIPLSGGIHTYYLIFVTDSGSTQPEDGAPGFYIQGPGGGGIDEPELKIIDVFICKLRKKLSTATAGESYIETVWGRGYVLRDPEHPAGLG